MGGRGLNTRYKTKSINRWVVNFTQADCDYRYLYVGHNYLFYRIEKDKIIIAGMFDDREDFMYKLFGISTTSQESLDYWDE